MQRPPTPPRVSTYRRPSPIHATALGAAVTVVALLPVFLTGAMAVQLTNELAFGSAGLGVAVAAYRCGGIATSVFMGRLADRLGALRTIRLAALVAMLSALGVASSVNRLATLVVWLTISGSALSLAQPGANRLLAATVDPRRLGTAFGVKQSAPPMAALLAGIAVPLLAVTVGWRWAFALAAVAAMSVLLTTDVPPTALATARAERAARTGWKPLPHRRVIALLALGFGLGTFTSSAVTTFYVVSAAEAGSSSGFAGMMLALASLAAVGARVGAGIISDRLVRGHLLLCAGMVGVGSGGIALLATGNPVPMVFGLLIALTGSWGFNGVFWYALVRSYPEAPGRITGVVSPGGLLGSTLGPLLAGLVIEMTSYRVAWLSMAAFGLVAATTLALGGRELRKLET